MLLHRRRIDEHQQRVGLEHDGHTAVLGPTVVRQMPAAGHHGRRARAIGHQKYVLQYGVHDRQRGRLERGGRRWPIPDEQAIRFNVSSWSGGRHSGAYSQRLGRRQSREDRTVLTAFQQHYFQANAYFFRPNGFLRLYRKKKKKNPYCINDVIIKFVIT